MTIFQLLDCWRRLVLLMHQCKFISIRFYMYPEAALFIYFILTALPQLFFLLTSYVHSSSLIYHCPFVYKFKSIIYQTQINKTVQDDLQYPKIHSLTNCWHQHYYSHPSLAANLPKLPTLPHHPHPVTPLPLQPTAMHTVGDGTKPDNWDWDIRPRSFPSLPSYRSVMMIVSNS